MTALSSRIKAKELISPCKPNKLKKARKEKTGK